MSAARKGVRAAIFDMDGVVTRTADLHAAAWKQTFDELLQRHAPDGVHYRPFDEHAEYLAYVDGKPRGEGIRSFLRARGLVLTAQEEEDAAARKDSLFERLMCDRGVRTFGSTIAMIETMRSHGVKTGIVTSSRHGRQILQMAGIAPLFDTALDGVDLEDLGLKGKPSPDMFLHAAQALGVAPRHAMIVEDAMAGVQAGRRGEFGLVVGIDRGANADALDRAGADLVVPDLGVLDLEALDAAYRKRQDSFAWRVEQEGFDRARERQMESLFAIGNGYLGVRGALDSPLPGSQSDLFIAGIYDRKRTDLPYSEIEFLTPGRVADPYGELVPLPFPFRLMVSAEDTPLDFGGNYGIELVRLLDMHSGMLHITAVYETPDERRTTVRTRRCASLADPHLLLQEAIVTPENHGSRIALAVSLEEPELAARHPHLELLEHVREPGVELVRYITRASRFEISIASRNVTRGNTLRRAISVFTSRDTPHPGAAALAHAQALEVEAFDVHVAAHADKWRDFWSRADVRIPGRPAVEQALRFGCYHLRLGAGDDPRVSIGARTLTGRAYEGHVFWDTEIFMLPFFLYVEPACARNLLLYRFHTLEGARRHARQIGCRGACFAWESTVSGDDVTPDKIVLRSTGKEIPVFTGTQQVHVTADVAYAVWRYWEATRDEAFLLGPGAEILCETARFWASRVVYDNGRFHIRGVVGPDEYHHDVNDNAYTNWMTRFNLERAAWIAQHCGKNSAEAQEWDGIARELYIPAPDERGVIEQFEGFFALDDYPLPGNERFKAPVSRLFDWEQINRVKLIKQADVLMLPFLFPEEFSDDVVAANYRYYEPLTDHGSSLSPSVHAAIAGRLGLLDDAKKYFKQSLWLDLSDAMNNSMLGVHPAAMGGTWQALVFGFLGVRFDEDGPRADARAAKWLPEAWDSIELKFTYRGKTHVVQVRQGAEREINR